MNSFDIREIPNEMESTAGIADGCELCGHCLFARRSQSGQIARCGPAAPAAMPAFMSAAQAEGPTVDSGSTAII